MASTTFRAKLLGVHFLNTLFTLHRRSIFPKMSKQKTLSAFFKVLPVSKRSMSEGRVENLSKKAKLDDGEAKENISSNQVNADSMDHIEPQNAIIEEINEYVSKYKILDKRLGPSWFKALKPQFDKPYFHKLNEFVTSQRSNGIIYPPEDQVWSWTRQCSIDSIKVVILGQDPYHNPGQAHGLCFSVAVGVPPPPSLLNMYKELQKDIEGFKAPKHGYLVGWARQGVLLLNAVLTVKKNSPNSHVNQGWEDLTSAVIKYLNEKQTGIVFLLWGAYAQKKADFVDKKKHHVLRTAHPSPLSASRGFFGCQHFSKCNEFLKSIGKRQIDWCHLPEK